MPTQSQHGDHRDMQQMLIPYHGIILLEKSQNIELVDGTVHITLCAMATEAFLQDLRSYYQSIGKNRPYPVTEGLASLFKPTAETRNAGGGAMISGRLETLCELEQQLWSTIEELEQKPLSKKYKATLKLLNPSWQNDGAFGNFQTLIELRNSLVHIKSEELNISNEGKFLTPKLIQDKLPKIKLNTREQQASWIEALDSSDVITWARVTTHKIITQTLELLPDTAISNNFRGSYYSSLCTLKI